LCCVRANFALSFRLLLTSSPYPSFPDLVMDAYEFVACLVQPFPTGGGVQSPFVGCSLDADLFIAFCLMLYSASGFPCLQISLPSWPNSSSFSTLPTTLTFIRLQRSALGAVLQISIKSQSACSTSGLQVSCFNCRLAAFSNVFALLFPIATTFESSGVFASRFHSRRDGGELLLRILPASVRPIPISSLRDLRCGEMSYPLLPGFYRMPHFVVTRSLNPQPVHLEKGVQVGVSYFENMPAPFKFLGSLHTFTSVKPVVSIFERRSTISCATQVSSSELDAAFGEVSCAFAMVRVPNKSRPPRRPQRARSGPRGARVAILSDCARNYFAVLENPFSGAVSCVPATTNFPTMKHSVRAQGIMYTGTQGFGYVCVSPIPGMWTDNQFVSVSGVGFDGATIATGTTGMASVPSNSPYALALVRQQMQGRVVACGLRVRNTTALLNRGGSLVGIESLSHASLVGQGFSDLLAQDTAEKMDSTSNVWSSVTWHPEDEDEYDYFDSSELAGANVFPVLAFVAIAPGVTAAGTQQQYEWEAYLAFEAKGSVVHGLTPSFSDPIGLGLVRNSTATVALRKPQLGDRGSFVQAGLNRMVGLARTVMTTSMQIAPYVPPLLKAAAPVVARAVLPRLIGPAPVAVPRIANASSQGAIAPFPVIFDNGQCALYGVLDGDGSGDGRTTDGFCISGYLDLLQMSTGKHLSVVHLNPQTWAPSNVQAPPVRQQSLQAAVYAFLHLPQIPEKHAFSGVVKERRILPVAGLAKKALFVEKHSGVLVRSPQSFE